MPPTDDRTTDDTREDARSTGTARDDRRADDGAAAWFAASTFRIALAFVGLILLLFALGQAVGMDLIGMVVEALNTQIGLWLTVAVFGLVLIVVALRGFGTWTE